MKTFDLVMLWAVGLWTVIGLAIIADSRYLERALLSVPVIFIGWILCGLIWVTVRYWPKKGPKN